MTEKLYRVLNRLKKIRRGETVSLTWWEAGILLDYIEELKGERKCGSTNG